ncbi:M48 family metalloprotease [Agrobacterium larrymoorei]|uniref:Peptidase M48 domain-containing protein n=1 Tax=Agrobacterium larrymoorei TaxID=160699 RepID=A0ABU0UQM3_9HYPH|nr:M48 family metalloprotease [Agrobacterium larrymoorei]MDQ1187274.1 hypothetical protein [Agrobacterium larrymoorei]
MATIILAAGRRFGRFTLLFLIALLSLIMSLCFFLLDQHVIWLFVLIGFALWTVDITVALLKGIFFANLSSKKVNGISRAEAPGLWSMWEAVAGAAVARKTTITLSDALNASIRMHRALLGFRQHYQLSVGIPLLAVTDKEAMFAILMHENGHVLNEDVNGKLRLAELEESLNIVFDFAPPDKSITGHLLYALWKRLSPSFAREKMRLSRDAEIKADLEAAKGGHGEEAARALLLVDASAIFLQQTFYESLRKEGAGTVPPVISPTKSLLNAVSMLNMSELLNSYARHAWSIEVDELSSHPSCAQRLSALGYAELFPIEPVARSALALLGDDFAKRVFAELDELWTNPVPSKLQS